MTREAENFTGRLLIAMPGMSDPRFAQSVVYIYAHGDEGAFGIIINKRNRHLQLGELIDQLGLKPGKDSIDLPIHYGGPVETTRGFVLFAGAEQGEPAISLNASRDFLEDLEAGQGPERALLAFGYAGWSPGQLEDEIADNGWLLADARESIVFAGDNARKWQDALASIGVNAALLSASAGHA